MKKIKNLKLFGLFQLTMLFAVYAYPVQHDPKSPALLPAMPRAMNYTSNTMDRLGIYQYWKSTIVFKPAVQSNHVSIAKSYTNAWLVKNHHAPFQYFLANLHPYQYQ